MSLSPSALADLATNAKAWPFEQARELKARIDKLEKAGRPADAPVVFETGYGPSGLPHIGTFGEVVRTSMVRKAFETLTGKKTRIICVSDDMDGMRKIPDTVPNPDLLKEFLQKPLTAVPDPFGTHESYGAHMNARLRAFLDSFSFEYEFASATELYKTGVYDAMLLRCAERYDDIMKIMLPTLGGERQETYSPFLPISPQSGRVLYVAMKKVDAKTGAVTFADEDGTETTVPVTGGHVKLQWKPDFGMRWAALGVDFEMFGKDHQANAPVYSKICRVLGAEPPQQYVYELFLDDKGEKISKTKGNGISVEQWLTYAPDESLALYMWQKPRTAKRLHFDVIPKAVDEYITFLEKFPKETPEQQLENPVWAIHGGLPPKMGSPVSFAMLLNLVAAANASTKEVLWGFIRKQAPDATPLIYPLLDRLVGYALKYYADFVKPSKVYRAPTDKERTALEDLAARLETYDGPLDGEALQTLVFSVGTDNAFEPLRAWFTAIYEVLLGQSQGPRFGGFVALYGVKETAALIRDALQGKVG
jgi:lysyl-tRNA synthetase class 1